MKRSLRPFLTLIPLLQPLAAFSQIPPDIGRVLEDQKKLFQPAIPLKTEPFAWPDDNAARLKSSPDELRVLIRQFKLEGDIRAFPVATLMGLLDDLVGKKLSFSEINDAAERITNYYRKHGFFLAATLVPKQDVTDGVITFVVLEGRVNYSTGVDIRGSGLRIKPQILRDIVQTNIPESDAINKESLERALLLISDLPGLTATSRLAAGVNSGETKIAVQVAEGDLIVPSLSFNNFGNRYTGSGQVVLGGSLNDPLKIGDQLTINYSTSFVDQLHASKLGYSLPLGSAGWRTGLNYTYVNFRLAGLDPDPKSTGTADDWNLFARYPMIRTRLKSLYFNASYDLKNLYSDAFGAAISNKRVDAVALALNWENQDEFLSGGFNSVLLSGTFGNLDLSRVPKSEENDAASARTSGGYSKLAWNASRIQRINDDVSLLISAAGQEAFKNLDGSEKFSLGGPTGVRAYPGGEASGDKGYRLSIEPRWNVGRLSEDIDLQFSAFYDWGQITQNHSIWPTASMTTPNTYELSGCGIGVALSKPGLADFRMMFANRLGHNPGANPSTGKDSDGRKDASRIWLTLTLML